MTRGLVLLLLLLSPAIFAEEPLSQAKPVPRMQVLPLPQSTAAFTDEGRELTRYWFDPAGKRTFFYPLNGPSGRSLTRMGHPRDPNGHSHHNSVWISHNDIAGVNFWMDSGKGRIVQKRVHRYEDSDDEALAQVELHWLDDADRVLLLETRTIRVLPAEDRQWWLLLELEFNSPGEAPVKIGDTPFGFIGVRMAKTIGVRDGGGTILNSEGGRNEAGVFRRPARWCDYSGPIARDIVEGITLMDHPSNPGHPSPIHVRDDGWMGVCANLATAREVAPGTPLVYRYALFMHAGQPDSAELNRRYDWFAKTEAAPAVKRK